MKKIILTICILFTAAAASAQALPDYNSYKLKTPADFAAAESAVIKAANYVLSTPITSLKPDNTGSMAFIIQWMTDVDYTFNVLPNEAVTGPDMELMPIYMAAMAKYGLENKDKINDFAAMELGTWKLMAEYVGNPAHNVKLTPKLKKLVEANKAGTMQKFIKDNPAPQ